MILGVMRQKIQNGVGVGDVKIDKINPAKCTLIINDHEPSDIVPKAYILDEETIRCNVMVSWTLIEYGGAV